MNIELTTFDIRGALTMKIATVSFTDGPGGIDASVHASVADAGRHIARVDKQYARYVDCGTKRSGIQECRFSGEARVDASSSDRDCWTIATAPRSDPDASPATPPVSDGMTDWSGRFSRHQWLVGVLLAVLILSVGGLAIWQSYRKAIEETKIDMRDLGIVLAEQATRYVQSIDQLMREVQFRVQVLDIRAPEAFGERLRGADITRFLTDRNKYLPQAHATEIFDAGGSLVSSSRTLLQHDASIAGSDYFQHFRDHADEEIFVSLPARDRGTGRMTTFLARRISGPNGVFLGTVVASVDLDYLLNLYHVIGKTRYRAISLLRRDGVLLARYPSVSSVGKMLPADSQWYQMVAAGGATYRSRGYFTGGNVITSANPLSNYPLVINVSVHDENALAAWRQQALYMAAGSVALAALVVVLLGMFAERSRRQERHVSALARTAGALRSSENRLRDFAELASDWFWELDADLRFKDIAAGVPFRLSNDRSHIGKRPWEVSDTSRDPDGWAAHQFELENHQRFIDFRFDGIGPDGMVHHVSVSGTPIWDSAGQFAGYRGVGSNITAEVKAETELRAAKARAERAETLLRDAVDSISEGFVIFDQDDRFVMCNEAYRGIYPNGANILVPGAPFEDIVRSVLADGGYIGVHGCEEEWIAQRVAHHREAIGARERCLKDNRWIRSTDRRMKNGGIAGLRIDITDLKRAKIALREKQAHLDRAQSIAGIGSWELDLASECYTWSDELYVIWGLPRHDFQPTRNNLVPHVHHDDCRLATIWFDDLRQGRGQSAFELRAIRPDGTERLLRLEGRAVADSDGIVRRLTGTMQDVTERRRIEKQLAQAQKMEAIGNLTGGMAHDFNNVLGIIVGNLDLLQPLISDNEAALVLCGEALDGATRCADLISRLLAFARRQSLHPEMTNVNRMINGIARLLGRAVGERVTVDLDLHPEAPPVVVDPVQLEAALINLATNARDAMPKGGRLAIVTRAVRLDTTSVAHHPDVAPGDYTVIEVSDTGVGIAPEIIGQIFEPFFTTKAAGKGSGLGLSMVFGFIKQSGGHLSVYSEPGLGTTFRIYLPQSDAGGTRHEVSSDPAAIIGGDETVLVVEDNSQLRSAAKRQLAELGYRTLEAENGAAALEILLKEDRIDLLFTDMVMPGGIDGLELAQRTVRLERGTRILLTSGFPGVRGSDEGHKTLPFSLLKKPYRRDDLARAVREILDRDADHDGDHAVMSRET